MKLMLSHLHICLGSQKIQSEITELWYAILCVNDACFIRYSFLSTGNSINRINESFDSFKTKTKVFIILLQE